MKAAEKLVFAKRLAKAHDLISSVFDELIANHNWGGEHESVLKASTSTARAMSCINQLAEEREEEK